MKYFFLLLGFSSLLFDEAYTQRKCKKNEWSCDEGLCIDVKLKCNGALDCFDGSDETFLLCRNTVCPEFKCLYGGCVASNATCNGVRDCVDNSDELLYKCRNESTYTECNHKIPFHAADKLERRQQCELLAKTCKDGEVLSNFKKCDGKLDCEDGSDETLETCATDQRNCKLSGLGQRFRCKYGACVDQSKVCDGVLDCVDGSDELYELCHETKKTVLWDCDDGTQINSSLKCNGAIDCIDGSDESFINCRNNDCTTGFRCVYGGCVNNNSTCNGVKDCADNSDELLTKCRNEQTYAECVNNLDTAWMIYNIENMTNAMERCNYGDRFCKNGQELVRRTAKCDGRVHCEDGSDETLDMCSTDRYNCHVFGNFRCQNGACVDKSKVCNKIKDCADGSDELDGICNAGRCVLPEYPENGIYTVLEKPEASPGQDFMSALLVYHCKPEYKLSKLYPYVYCTNGTWADEKPICNAQCHLKKDPSIEFWCLLNSPLPFEGARECEELVPEGTTVRPKCREPNYHYTRGVLSYMHCVDGRWDREVPTCTARCGLVTSQGDTLVINGTSAKKGEHPWHAAIYRKHINNSHIIYEQICGGSLVATNIIISAAHCFWSDYNYALPAEQFAVAVGKIYRPWINSRETDAQKSEVQRIIIPDHFRGVSTSFQDDIALLVLTSPVEYRPDVRPVCIDFDFSFESRQLAIGETGKVAGWGLTSEDGKASQVLKVASLPFVDTNTCYQNSLPSFHMFITSDKFCAGNQRDATLCQGDSGGGLVFLSKDRGQERYYLRGIVSTKPPNEHICNANSYTTFTSISKHQTFIEEHLN